MKMPVNFRILTADKKALGTFATAYGYESLSVLLSCVLMGAVVDTVNGSKVKGSIKGNSHEVAVTLRAIHAFMISIARLVSGLEWS